MARVSIEDCLHKMPNRFALVTVAANRTRQLMEGHEPLIKTKNKLGVTALREIAEGLINANENLDQIQKDAKAEVIQRRDHFLDESSSASKSTADSHDESGEHPTL